MANGFSIVSDLARHIGQTVTIFTTSGGESGRGFTGVLATVNCNFVRLITQIGPAPGCALGSCCDRERRPFGVEGEQLGGEGRINCSGNRGLGSIVDIPVDRIAAFVHNAVGSGW
ncbi:hypothetical protein JK636_09420 [Clostridium sp. YIM B02515]|uniref:Uncharacterized protein n=1 Tax=Clostridium rhizosphaerae TaxID=2803861 RepID=A0ABS1T9G4_9CLOT|nr:hypothetical protein [Clostridium rhizosphaerae]MBL4935979.1 hypothetical protein [Clostridium rhizosphaerae]